MDPPAFQPHWKLSSVPSFPSILASHGIPRARAKTQNLSAPTIFASIQLSL